ncbi:MAG: SMC-Scp complex subunit ScpB [Candidatus Diapherotrites archaeon]|nr:SMC-Scp complex subunit ScpB [Candidatus Diapherotrites archaeon]MDZ4256451.1 SMC-Scp complex subunit ScpB [archaeon]
MVLSWIRKWITKKDSNKPVGENDLPPSGLETPEKEFLDDEIKEGSSEIMDSPEIPPLSLPRKSNASKLIEAALFMSAKGLNVEELSKVTGRPILETRGLIPGIIEGFNAQDTALEIVEDTGGYRMKVRAPFDEKVTHLAGGSELNPGEMKTLAFIAYKQPLLQSKLVQVRSNTAYEHLQVLVEKGFVSREPKGRSYVLRTTKKFSEYFGTHALKVTPMKSLQTEGKIDHSQAEELS